jgi:hypothetical protein
VVERSAVNRLVVGSNPTAGATLNVSGILKNPKGRFSIGHTDNLDGRLRSHNRTDSLLTSNLSFFGVERRFFVSENAQPAYAEGFGVAGAHLFRRSECEGGAPNILLRKRSRAGVQFRASIPQFDVQRSTFGIRCLLPQRGGAYTVRYSALAGSSSA